MGLLAASVLTLLIFAFVFWPERSFLRQTEKTRFDYLEERKQVIYNNLRDLNFDYLAGKHPEADFISQRQILEDEAAGVMGEMDAIRSARPEQAAR
jgi:hypothetical protein